MFYTYLVRKLLKKIFHPTVFLIHNEAKAYKSLWNFPSNMISHDTFFFQIVYSDKALNKSEKERKYLEVIGFSPIL